MTRALLAAVFLVTRLASAAESPVRVQRSADALHGRVVLDAQCRQVNVPGVTFDHWRHRLMYTCRVCHSDLGFALKAGETGVSATTNGDGRHCGACHDGKAVHDGNPIFQACRGWPLPDATRGCTRCHTGAPSEPGPGYDAAKRKLPVDEADYIDWEAAERRHLFTLEDTAPGAAKRPLMRNDREVTIAIAGTWLENVTFSHRKHATWNGCELCHPDIFPLGNAESLRYDMRSIRAGQYCGVCHNTVAFPLDLCKRCHAEREHRRMR